MHIIAGLVVSCVLGLAWLYIQFRRIELEWPTKQMYRAHELAVRIIDHKDSENRWHAAVATIDPPPEPSEIYQASSVSRPESQDYQPLGYHSPILLVSARPLKTNGALVIVFRSGAAQIVPPPNWDHYGISPRSTQVQE